MQQIFLSQLLHFLPSQHFDYRLQLRTIQENVVVLHHQQFTYHQNLVFAVLVKTTLVHQLIQLMRNYQVVVH